MCRSLSSVEEVKAAAKKFAALQEEAEQEAEEKNQDILDTARSGTSHISATGQYKCAPGPSPDLPGTPTAKDLNDNQVHG